jgi:uncharacterized protein
MHPTQPMRIVLISDTHGLLRPQALAAMQGCDAIVHAGDVGKPDILDALRAIAPLHAIRGNIDTAPWAQALPDVLDVEIAGVRLHVLHDLKTLAREPAGVDVVPATACCTSIPAALARAVSVCRSASAICICRPTASAASC